MSSRITIQEELNELNSSLPYTIQEPVFSVPNAYFENFALSVLAKIKGTTVVSAEDELNELSPVLAGMSRKMPFSVPQNYFSSLENELQVLTGNDELPAILAAHDRMLPYEVPVGYFENLPAQVLAKVPTQQAKVISLNRTPWMRIAVAAMIAGIIGISSIFYFNNQDTVDPASQPQAWMETKLKGVPDKDLEEFINTADIDAGNRIAGTKAHSSEVRIMLKDVSDNELEVFLAQVPGDDDELSVIN